MLAENSKTRTTVHGLDDQARGSFDSGKITETKPIGFPGESSKVDRVGPLFYWAWASSKGPALIGLHPHRGFEIASYVLEGTVGHFDTTGTRSRVAAGGAQVMQTGSGVSHEEEMVGGPTQFFQIWFEPDLREAVKSQPAYYEVKPEDVPVRADNGVRERLVIGPGAPVQLVTDATFFVVEMEAGSAYRRAVSPGRALAVVAMKGSGTVDGNGVRTRDFAVIESTADAPADAVFAAASGEPFHVAVVDVPLDPGYALVSK